MFHRTWQRTAVAAAGVLALALGACSSGGNAKPDDFSANRDGAMATYNIGDQFKATSPITFSIMLLSNAAYPYNKDWLFWQELAKRTNITLDPVVVPGSDYNQKRSVLVGAGDAPFIIPKTYHPDENAFVASGAILPVSDYIDLMPNLKEKIAKWNLKPEIDTLRQEDGKFYLLPGLHQNAWQDYTLAIRQDILDQLGLKMPTTWDELYTVLKAMKTAYPQSYPLSDRWSKPTPGGNLFSVLGAAYAAPGGWGYQNAVWDAGAGKYVFDGASDNYKAWVTYLNKLVSEGLLDPESFTQSDDQAKQKLVTGKSFVISTNAQTLVNEYRGDLTKAFPTAKITKVPFLLGPAGEVNPSSRLENGIMLSKKARDSKNFVAMIQFVDWLWYSDAGQQFAKWGVEGTTFVKDSSGKPTLAPDVNVVGLNPKGTKHLQKDFGFYNGVFAYGGKPELVQAFFSPEEQAFQKIVGPRKPAPWVTPPPAPLTDDEREQATLWEAGLKDYVFQQTLKFILGQRPLSDWGTYLTELKGKNMDQYIDMINKAQQRYKAKNG